MKTRLFIVVALAYSALAQSTGTFTPTGNMTAPRFIHTATLLPDGRVLIAGGNTTCYIGGTCLRPDHAELYDPATGTFTATTADAAGGVLLPDGRFLLIAGSGRMEFYDRYTGEFLHWGACYSYYTPGRTYCYDRYTGQFLHWGSCY